MKWLTKMFNAIEDYLELPGSAVLVVATLSAFAANSESQIGWWFVPSIIVFFISCNNLGALIYARQLRKGKHQGYCRI